MKYRILVLILILMAGTASADSIVSSELTNREQVRHHTSFLWVARIEATSPANTCYVDLKILNNRGDVVQTEALVFAMFRRTGVQREVKGVVGTNEEVARWASTTSKITCY